MQVPKPRSGVAMCMHTAEDAIYIYGGYSKVLYDNMVTCTFCHQNVVHTKLLLMLYRHDSAVSCDRITL